MFRTEMLSTFAFLLEKKGGFDESNPYIIGMRLPRYARNDILISCNDNDILKKGIVPFFFKETVPFFTLFYNDNLIARSDK